MPCTTRRQRGGVTGCKHRQVGFRKRGAQVGAYAGAERYSGDERLQEGTVNGDARSFLRQIGWYRGVPHFCKHTRPLRGDYTL